MELNQPTGHILRTWSGRGYVLPIDRDKYQSLLRYVAEMLAIHGCDNTLHHAETWAWAHNVAWSELNRGLRSVGGYCDCEIGLNSIPDGESGPDDW